MGACVLVSGSAGRQRITNHQWHGVVHEDNVIYCCPSSSTVYECCFVHFDGL